MFPGLRSVDVTEADEFTSAIQAALEVDGPSVVSVECAADEIPPFAAFLAAASSRPTATEENPLAQENLTHVGASA
jgi:acetolactate synthase-1/2/3 large subunit